MTGTDLDFAAEEKLSGSSGQQVVNKSVHVMTCVVEIYQKQSVQGS